MRWPLSPFADRAYALLRIVAGACFCFHGIQKIFGVLTDLHVKTGTQIWYGGIIELVAGAAISLGLFASFAAFVASGEMAVAYVQFHWKGAFDASFFPAINHGEMALVYSFLFLYVACRGAGRWSVAAALRGGRAGAAGPA